MILGYKDITIDMVDVNTTTKLALHLVCNNQNPYHTDPETLETYWQLQNQLNEYLKDGTL